MSRANRRPVSRRRFLTLLAILAVVFALVVLAAAVGWVGTYLVPLAVLLVMGVVVLWLLVQLVKRLPGGHDISDWWQ
jgi:fatty acid desaturase